MGGDRYEIGVVIRLNVLFVFDVGGIAGVGNACRGGRCKECNIYDYLIYI